MVGYGEILSIGGWITLMFYFTHKWMIRKDNSLGIRWTVFVYLILLILISIWSLWYKIFIE